jgi:hypothetical protein
MMDLSGSDTEPDTTLNKVKKSKKRADLYQICHIVALDTGKVEYVLESDEKKVLGRGYGVI